MPWSALPEHLNSPEKVEDAFPDDDALMQYGLIGRIWRRFQKASKPWTAFGPRATEWWAKWREIPKVLVAVGDKKKWRLEYTDSSLGEGLTKHPKKPQPTGFYVSTIQYWKKWGLLIQWPLFLAFHFYIDDVPDYPNHDGNTRVLFIRIGARRDADRVYWFPSFFIGLRWN